jgi:hypothetical protein
LTTVNFPKYPFQIFNQYIVLKIQEKKIIKKLNENYKLLYKKEKDCTDYYTKFLGLNAYMYSTENQVDFVLQSIIESDLVAKYSYKNGTRVKKGKFYKDPDGKEKFMPIQDFSHINNEPWPLKLSRFYAKELLKIENSGDKKL